jgi:hypothetical protein
MTLGSGWPSKVGLVESSRTRCSRCDERRRFAEPFALRYLNRLHWRLERPFERSR